MLGFLFAYPINCISGLNKLSYVLICLNLTINQSGFISANIFEKRAKSKSAMPGYPAFVASIMIITDTAF